MISILVLISQFAFASQNEQPKEWRVAQTEKVLVTSYDANCVTVRDKEGKKISMRRDGFKNMKLVSGSTQVEIHRETLDDHLCASEKNKVK